MTEEQGIVIKVNRLKHSLVCKDCQNMAPIVQMNTMRYQVRLFFHCICNSSLSQCISLYQYTRFISTSLHSSHQCFFHSKKAGVIYSNASSSFICFNCFYFTVHKDNFASLFRSSSLLFSYSKCLGLKCSASLKESSCIRSIVSLSNSKIAMVVDKRVCIWDYLLNKVHLNFYHSNYISDLVPLRERSKLLSFGYSLCVWDLSSLDNSKHFNLFDNDRMVQAAIELADGKIAFINDKGVFVWDYANEAYEEAFCGLYITSAFFYEMPRDNLIFSNNDTKDSIIGCSISNKMIKKIDVKSHIVLGELLSDYRIGVITEAKQFNVFLIGEKEEEIEFQCSFDLEIKPIGKGWEVNSFAKEMNDGTMLLSFNNQIFVLNTITGEFSSVLDESKGRVNKVALLSGGVIGILMNSSRLILYDSTLMQKRLEFVGKHGTLSSFTELSNGDIALSEIIQEFFYSLRVLQ